VSVRDPRSRRWPGVRYAAVSASRGFTLLEPLLALALFSMAVVVLTSSYLNIVGALASVQADREFEQEVRWVREQALLQPEREELEKGGELKTPAAKTLRWSASVEPGPIADLFMIDLNVEMATEKGAAREYRERLTVLRPAWSEPVERAKLAEDLKRRIEEDRRNRGIAAEKRT